MNSVLLATLLVLSPVQEAGTLPEPVLQLADRIASATADGVSVQYDLGLFRTAILLVVDGHEFRASLGGGQEWVLEIDRVHRGDQVSRRIAIVRKLLGTKRTLRIENAYSRLLQSESSLVRSEAARGLSQVVPNRRWIDALADAAEDEESLIARVTIWSSLVRLGDLRFREELGAFMDEYVDQPILFPLIPEAISAIAEVEGTGVRVTLALNSLKAAPASSPTFVGSCSELVKAVRRDLPLEIQTAFSRVPIGDSIEKGTDSYRSLGALCELVSIMPESFRSSRSVRKALAAIAKVSTGNLQASAVKAYGSLRDDATVWDLIEIAEPCRDLPTIRAIAEAVGRLNPAARLTFARALLPRFRQAERDECTAWMPVFSGITYYFHKKGASPESTRDELVRRFTEVSSQSNLQIPQAPAGG